MGAKSPSAERPVVVLVVVVDLLFGTLFCEETREPTV
jgi:hypothetical protein